MIRPGATLRIPNQDGIFHKIKSGETLAGVAKKYEIAADRIRQANGEAALNPFPWARRSSSRSQARSGGISPLRTTPPVRQLDLEVCPGEGFSSSSRSYRWPVVGKINSPFG